MKAVKAWGIKFSLSGELSNNAFPNIRECERFIDDLPEPYKDLYDTNFIRVLIKPITQKARKK